MRRQVTLEDELQESIATSATAIRHPWEHITVFDLVRVFQSESWAGSLTLADFNRVLDIERANAQAKPAAAQTKRRTSGATPR